MSPMVWTGLNAELLLVFAFSSFCLLVSGLSEGPGGARDLRGLRLGSVSGVLCFAFGLVRVRVPGWGALPACAFLFASLVNPRSDGPISLANLRVCTTCSNVFASHSDDRNHVPQVFVLPFFMRPLQEFARSLGIVLMCTM